MKCGKCDAQCEMSQNRIVAPDYGEEAEGLYNKGDSTYVIIRRKERPMNDQFVKSVPTPTDEMLELPVLHFEPQQNQDSISVYPSGQRKPKAESQQAWNEHDYDGTILPLPEMRF